MSEKKARHKSAKGAGALTGKGKLMATGKVIKQPRGLPVDTLLSKEHQYHRASVQAERQKLGALKEYPTQPSMFESMQEAETGGSVTKIYGTDLSWSQDQAVTALQRLLDATGYMGDEPFQENASQDWGKYPRVVLNITWIDFYEAYGLERTGNGRFSGKQTEDARRALLELSTKHFNIVLKRKKWVGMGKNRREVVDRIETNQPIIAITRGYANLELKEDAEMDLNGERPERATHLQVQVGPLLLEGIEDYYLLKPNGLHKMVRDTVQKKYPSPSIIRFIAYLLVSGTGKLSASRETLAKQLRLGTYVQHRKWKKLDEQLLECIEVAKKLGFLKSWEKTAANIFRFTLNEEQCSRLKRLKPSPTSLLEDVSPGSVS